MTYTQAVYVGQGPELLVDVKFHEQDRHWHLNLIVVLEYTVDVLWHVLHYYVQVYFILLFIVRS